MSYTEVQPTVSKESFGRNRDHEVYNHPAYGTVTLTHIQGGGGNLFGSDIGHLGRMRITVQRATLHRNLSNDWIHSVGGLPIATFEMSHAQFAEFITGVGRGDGTPCTLRYAATGPVENIPGIAAIETKQELFKREIKESVQHQIKDIENGLQRLQDMLDSGKLPKAELRALVHSLRCSVGNMPGNLKFVVDQAEEALEKATTNAKIEVEAFISATAKSLGLESIQQLTELQHLKD